MTPIRQEIHTRTRFAAKEIEKNVIRLSCLNGDFKYFAQASSKWSRKFVQAKRIYDHYINQINQSLKQKSK